MGNTRTITVVDDDGSAAVTARLTSNGHGPGVITELTLSAPAGLSRNVILAATHALLGPTSLILPALAEDGEGPAVSEPDTGGAEPGGGGDAPTLAAFAREWRRRAGDRSRVNDLARFYGCSPTTIRNWRGRAIEAGHHLD